MFASIRECTRAHPETFPQQRKSKIAIYHRARRSKFEIRNSSFILASLACFYAQFINIDESLNQKHLPCADCFQSIESSAHKRYITMDIDDANNGVAMNRRQLRLHRRPRYQAFVIIHLKEQTESGKASVQPRIDIPLTVEESTRMLRFKKELIATILDAVVFQRAGT